MGSSSLTRKVTLRTTSECKGLLVKTKYVWAAEPPISGYNIENAGRDQGAGGDGEKKGRNFVKREKALCHSSAYEW